MHGACKLSTAGRQPAVAAAAAAKQAAAHAKADASLGVYQAKLKYNARHRVYDFMNGPFGGPLAETEKGAENDVDFDAGSKP